jgi:excisionase family DNA binding protein
MTQTPEYVYTAAEVARELGVPVATVRQWLWDGRLRGHRSGGLHAGWRVRSADLAHFLAGQPTVAGKQPAPPPVTR